VAPERDVSYLMNVQEEKRQRRFAGSPTTARSERISASGCRYHGSGLGAAFPAAAYMIIYGYG
jgi:hypothetical protein